MKTTALFWSDPPRRMSRSSRGRHMERLRTGATEPRSRLCPMGAFQPRPMAGYEPQFRSARSSRTHGRCSIATRSRRRPEPLVMGGAGRRAYAAGRDTGAASRRAWTRGSSASASGCWCSTSSSNETTRGAINGSSVALAEFAIAGDQWTQIETFLLPKHPIDRKLPEGMQRNWEKNWVPFAIDPSATANIASR